MSAELIGTIILGACTIIGMAISWGRFEQKTNRLQEDFDQHRNGAKEERDNIWREIQKTRDQATSVDKDLARIHMEVEKEITVVALNVQTLSGKIDQIFQGVEDLKKMLNQK